MLKHILLILLTLSQALPGLAQEVAKSKPKAEPFCKLGPTELQPGECYCTSTAASMVSGRCVYQAFAFGNNHFNGLLTIANNQIKNVPTTGSHVNTIYPQQEIDRNRITWFFEDDDSNQAMGRVLHDADKPWRSSVARTVHLVSNVYFVDEGFESKLKLDLDFFAGKRTLPDGKEVPGKAVGGVVDGLLAGTFAIGNWYRSVLNLSLRSVSRGQMVSEKSNEIRVSCEEGGRCSLSDVDKVVLVTGTGSKDEDVGLEMSGVPKITTDSTGATIIEIDSLNYTLGEVKPKAEVTSGAGTSSSAYTLLNPYRKWSPLSNRSLTVRPGDIYVIYNQVADQRSHFTQILGRGKDTDRTQMIITLRALLDDGKGAAIESEPLEPGKYTEAEKREMDRVPYSFEDVLRSAEVSCPDGLRRPGSGEAMCILHFTKLNSKYLDLPIKITFGGKLNPADASKVTKTAAELYAGRGGYIELPRFRDSKHEIKVEIDDSNKPAKALRSLYKGAAGIKFAIGYYESSGRILFDPRLSELIKE